MGKIEKGIEAGADKRNLLRLILAMGAGIAAGNAVGRLTRRNKSEDTTNKVADCDDYSELLIQLGGMTDQNFDTETLTAMAQDNTFGGSGMTMVNMPGDSEGQEALSEMPGGVELDTLRPGNEETTADDPVGDYLRGMEF